MTKAPELLNNPFCGLCGQTMDAAECAAKATETSVDMALSLVDLINKARKEGRQAGLREAEKALFRNMRTQKSKTHFAQKQESWEAAIACVMVTLETLSIASAPQDCTRCAECDCENGGADCNWINTPTPPDETGCQECGGGENPVWFAPHDLWNRVMGGEDCKDDPGGILCPVCFIRRAERVGIKEIWRVGPAEDNPPRSKGMTVQEAFMSLVRQGVAEGEKAMRKFPQPNYVISKFAEEAGEVVKAAIHCAEDRETVGNVVGEMRQVIGMMYRLWVEGDQVHGLRALSGDSHE